MSEKWDEIKNDIKDLSDENLDEIVRNDNQIDELSKLINKEINNKVKKSFIRILTITVIGVLLLNLILSPLVKLCYVNLENYDNEIAFEEVDKMDVLLISYFNVLHPYFYGRDVEVDDLGFGKYRVNYNGFDIREPRYSGANTNNYVDVYKGNLIYPESIMNVFTVTMDPFGSVYELSEQDEVLHEQYEVVKKLPESSIIYATIGFKEKVIIEDVFEMFKEFEDSLLYVNISNNGPSGYGESNDVFGFSLESQVYIDQDAKYDPLYPNIILKDSDKLDVDRVDEYKQHFKSNINYLNDSKFNFNASHFAMDLIVDAMNSEEFTYPSSGVVVCMKKDEMIKFYEDNSEILLKIDFDEVKLYE